MADPKMATTHPVVTQLPLLSPKSAKDFKNCCLNYFVNAKGEIDDNIKVSCTLGCFENDLINNWISFNCEHFTVLTFPEFMTKFRSRWLPYNWEQMLHGKILSARLYPKKQCFEDWASQIQSLNVSLQGTVSHLDDDHICLQLEAGLDKDLQTIARDVKAHEEVSLHPWIAIIKDLDNCCIVQQKRVAEAIEEAIQ